MAEGGEGGGAAGLRRGSKKKQKGMRVLRRASDDRGKARANCVDGGAELEANKPSKLFFTDGCCAEVKCGKNQS